MREIKHTPGPWTLESRGWDNQLIYGQDERVPGGRRFIADVSLTYDGAEANARLIAAAPELLEALQGLVDAYESIMKSEFDFPGRPWTPERDNDEDALKAHAAISKATGD